jgi:hypothetical protein
LFKLVPHDVRSPVRGSAHTKVEPMRRDNMREMNRRLSL